MAGDLALELAWDDRGLVPAVVQDARTGQFLMLAWMNREALEQTRETGFAHFYSRSRQALWKKGETSGNTLAVREVRVDCDADAVLVRAEPAGPACHTGKPSCFFRRVGEDGLSEDDGPQGASAGVVDRVWDVLRARRETARPETSYTAALLHGGFPKILAKIAEEHGELAAELPEGPDGAVVHEAVDLLFHVLVGLVARDIPTDALWRELGRRFGVSGHEEKAARHKAQGAAPSDPDGA